jgi:hypothetical protein
LRVYVHKFPQTALGSDLDVETVRKLLTEIVGGAQ